MPTTDEMTAVVLRRSAAMPYQFTIFLGAFLLFSVQLIVAKYFLPWFGGAPSVWATCMFFFQSLLLGGYAYAHGVAHRLSVRRQRAVHLTILSAAVVLLVALACIWPTPLTPGSEWKPQGSSQPVGHLLLLLSLSVGLPYLVLSTTSPLLQAWFARTESGASPYRLYALSNLGSLLALVSYPFLIEPRLTLRTQARWWSLAFAAYALGCGYCALAAARAANPLPRADCAEQGSGDAGAGPAAKPSVAMYVLWLSLAACGSLAFLASSNQMCQDIGVVPLLWVLPLSLYLLTFIICFEKPGWYTRALFHPALGVALLGACLVLNAGSLESVLVRNVLVQIAVYAGALFAVCMVCHGELYRLRPAPAHLTSFYLMVSIGGALGGVIVALAAPFLFRAFWEFQLAIWASALLMFVVLMRDRTSWLYCTRYGMLGVGLAAACLPAVTAFITSTEKTHISELVPLAALLVGVLAVASRSPSGYNHSRARAVPLFCGAALAILAVVLFSSARAQLRNSVLVHRNFYGVLTLRELDASEPDKRAYQLIHGRVSHGLQYQAGEKRGFPTSYYSESSGVGLVWQALRHAHGAGNPHLRVGIVGLGVGTLAAYGRRGDALRFYEINPEVVRIAQDARYFTYLGNCPATVEVVLGDARLSMEHELRQNQAQRFDLLVVDAFAGDAVPVHLLTQQAFQIYLDDLGPDGVLAIHISNTYLDLSPVLRRIANYYRLDYRLVHTPGVPHIGSESIWALLSADRALLDSVWKQKEGWANEPPTANLALWTDEYSNLLQVLRR